MLRVSSFLSFSAQDGPSVRSVLFLHGCTLNCVYCHNPECRYEGYSEVSVDDMSKRVARYKAYYGDSGGLTVSGGEPLLQVEEVTKLLRTLRESGLHTCLETSGYSEGVSDADLKVLLAEVDLVYCDLKFVSEAEYLEYTGVGMASVLSFIKLCEASGTETVLRMVVVPGINDTIEYMQRVKEFMRSEGLDSRLELLAYSDMCELKYARLQKPYKLKGMPAMRELDIKKLREAFT